MQEISSCSDIRVGSDMGVLVTCIMCKIITIFLFAHMLLYIIVVMHECILCCRSPVGALTDF